MNRPFLWAKPLSISSRLFPGSLSHQPKTPIRSPIPSPILLHLCSSMLMVFFEGTPSHSSSTLTPSPSGTKTLIPPFSFFDVYDFLQQTLILPSQPNSINFFSSTHGPNPSSLISSLLPSSDGHRPAPSPTLPNKTPNPYTYPLPPLIIIHYASMMDKP